MFGGTSISQCSEKEPVVDSRLVRMSTLSLCYVRAKPFD